jgi:hypothetical protein
LHSPTWYPPSTTPMVTKNLANFCIQHVCTCCFCSRHMIESVNPRISAKPSESLFILRKKDAVDSSPQKLSEQSWKFSASATISIGTFDFLLRQFLCSSFSPRKRSEGSKPSDQRNL